MKFYLRVEGVNLNNFISDTMDISTIRGGGLLLLDAINKINKDFEQLEAISTGASSGLFSFEATDFENAKTLKQQVVNFLNTDSKLKHATFVIETLPFGNSFNEDKEKLLALNRWQQMQSPTLIVPDNNQQNTEYPLCSIDHIRPTAANRAVNRGDDQLIVSESVFQRREYGREQKQDFYRRQTGLQNLPSFVSDFTELTDDKKRGNLNGKMAIIYLDGNRFGKIQQEICQDDQDGTMLSLFDDDIKGKRKNFLTQFLTDTIRQPAWTYENKHRLEILLWGGDEILLVVPAWLGWWSLNYFFQTSQNWSFEGSNLTHAAGLVFCHHNAPIHRITDLAKDLGELAKEKSRDASYVAYQVLESFDYAGEDLESFRDKLCGNSGLKSNDLIISGNEINQALYAMEPIKRAIPKGKVYAIVQALLQNSTEKNELINEAEMQLNATQSEAFKKLRSCFGEGASFWLHLIELWDYIELWELIE